MKNILDEVLTVTECAERYRVDPHTVACAIRNGRLVVGRDCRKSNATWIILDKAAAALWGYRQHYVPENHRRCRKCGGVFPLTIEHFRPYQTKNQQGLSHTCRDCLRLQNAGYRDKNRARRREQDRVNARRFRAANPGYSARQNRRYRLRKAINQQKGDE